MTIGLKTVAVGTATLLLTGLGLTASTGSASADIDGRSCPGMTAPNNNNTVNQAPTPVNDKAKVLAGSTVAFRPLTNDTDPDGDRLALVNVDAEKGETCVSKVGTVLYQADSSTRNSTQKITYGVTDGDRYRTATATVTVEGLKPLRVTTTRYLKYKKHSKKVKTFARVAFRNLNSRNVVVAAGSPKKENASFTRTIAPGRTVVYVTKFPRVQYFSFLSSRSEFTLVSAGFVNTKNGRQVRTVDADDFADDSERAMAARQVSSARAYSLR